MSPVETFQGVERQPVSLLRAQQQELLLTAVPGRIDLDMG